MASENRYHWNTAILLTIVALAMAAAFGLLLTGFSESFAAADALPPGSSLRDQFGPHGLFVLLSLAFGWGSTWVAEQRGLISSLTVVGSAVVTFGAGYLCALACVRPLPGNIPLAFVLSAVAFIGAGIFRQHLET
jgi:hypothetical protein